MASPTTPRVIAVTGASGYVGERIVERLIEEASVEKVVGVDLRPSRLEHPKLVNVQQDVAKPLEALFTHHGIEAVIHLAFVLRQARDRERSRRTNVGGASSVLRASDAAGVRRIVLLSSSTVYGAHAGNEGPLDEEAPLRPPPAFDYANDKAEVESLYRDYAAERPHVGLTVLRACVVMGPNADNFITKALDRPVLIGVGRSDPGLQFVHEEDLTELLWRCVSESHPGTFNVAGPGSVPWSEVVRMGGKRLVRLPAPLAYAITDLTWKLHVQNDSPAVGLDWIRWPWQASTERIERELGYTFKHSSLAALQSFFETPARRRKEGCRPRRDATRRV